MAPLPQWDPANPVAVNWGGSAFSVTAQAENPELAAKVAFGLYADAAVARRRLAEPDHLPAQPGGAELGGVRQRRGGLLQRPAGQQGGLRAGGHAYEGFTYSPFGQFYYPAFTEQIAAINAGEMTGAEAAEHCRRRVTYAEQQGFTVTLTLTTDGAPARIPGWRASTPSRRTPHDTAAPAAPRAAPPEPRRRRRTPRAARRRHRVVGWLFVAPFGLVFPVFLVAPLAYAFYLSLFNTAWPRRHQLRGSQQLRQGLHRPELPVRASGSSSASRSSSSRCRCSSRWRSRWCSTASRPGSPGSPG